MKYYIHYVLGRIRIQTPLIHDNPQKGEEFKMFMKGFNGISEVEIHTVTGSAVIHFDEKVINCEQIIGIIEKHNYFRLAEAETCDEVIEKTTKKVVEVAEQVIIDSFEGGIGA
jgi:copper chaperone CopZ